MKKKLIDLVRILFLRLVGRAAIEKLIVLLSKLSYIDLLILAYQQIGILKYLNDDISGEKFVIEQVLKNILKKDKLTVFDVGANIGNYTENIKNTFQNSVIYAFEPNPKSFEILSGRFSSSQVNCYSLGLSSKSSKQRIYTYAFEKASEHASLYRSVLSDLHRVQDLSEMEFSTITLDEFCKENTIDFIDFLKIDTEGHEFEILLGAKNMLTERRINIIQFEFNEMNIISRVFLKDFYELLDKDFNIFRIDSNKLIPLFEYSSTNEIFKFQNFLAISKSLKSL